jgi:hypothetical protein
MRRGLVRSAAGTRLGAAAFRGRTIWIADAHRGDGKRYVVRADEKLTASGRSIVARKKS